MMARTVGQNRQSEEMRGHSHFERQIRVQHVSLQCSCSLFLFVSVSEVKKIFSYHIFWLYQLDCIFFLLNGLVGTSGKEVILVQNTCPALCFTL